MEFKLGDIKLPNFGFGTYGLKNNEETEEIIATALNSGLILIDTASSYENLESIRKGIKKSNKKREEIIISSKLWNTDRGYENVINACKRTIKELDCDYLDSYLIHWPASPKVYDNWIEINNETWRALEYLYENGYVKTIGVSNFTKMQMEELMKSAKIKPMVNQLEFHIGFTQPENVKYCLDNNILVEGWSPFASGKLLKKEVLKEMADKYKVDVARLCLRWSLQNNVLPIFKAETKGLMLNNQDVFNFEISKEDMDYLNNLPYMGGLAINPEEFTLFE